MKNQHSFLKLIAASLLVVSVPSIAWAQTADMTFNPDSTGVMLSDTVTVVVRVEAGVDVIDGAQAYVNFDPTVLQVQSLTAGTSLPLALEGPSFVNAAGTVNYAAGTITLGPTGTFDLLTIVFDASGVGSTNLVFGTVFPRQTDITSTGASILGNAVSSNITVTGAPGAPPVFDSYPAVVTAEATSGAGALVNFAAPTTTGGVGTVVVACTPVSGSQFVLGSTPVSCDATDDNAQTAMLGFSVDVTDTTAPVISIDGADPLFLAFGDSFVDPGATANDAVDGSFAAIASGTVDNLVAADYPITYNATDVAGNLAAAVMRTVTVTADTTDPVFDAYMEPGAVAATDVNGAVVSFPLPTATDNSGVPPGVACLPASGSTFVIGDTEVTCTATDGSGNDATMMFDVTVNPLAIGAVLYRINVGGAGVAAADASMPDWAVDNVGSPSPLRVAGSNGTPSTAAAIDISDPSIGAAAAIEALFQTERFDDNAAPEMLWNMPLPVSTTVEVRLYFAETFADLGGAGTLDKRGLRTFSVTVEGAAVPAMTDLDQFAVAGGLNRGFMLSHVATVSDGVLDIGFVHGVENTALKAIEIVVADAADVPPVLDPISDQNMVPGGSLDVPITVSGQSALVVTTAPTNLFDGAAATLNGTTMSFTPSAGDVGNYTATVRAYGSPVSLQRFTLTVSAVPDPSILHRVNVGGPQLSPANASGPDWAVDTAAAASPFRTAGGGNLFATGDAISGTPINEAPGSLFQTERWDPGSGAEMAWAFPVVAGTEVEVRLYLAEVFANAAAARVFDVLVEGAVTPPPAFDDIDIFAQVGHDAGLVLSHTLVVSDGTLNLEFIHGNDNPAIKGIEIVEVTAPDTVDPEFDPGYMDPAAMEGNVLGGAIVNYTLPTATDDTDPAPVVGCVPAPGATFPVGTNVDAVTCIATDASGNSSMLGVTITVVDTTPPSITIDGANPLLLTVGDMYLDPGATANDIVDGSFAAIATGMVDTGAAGSNLITYNASDIVGNPAAAVMRTVTVEDPPIDTSPTFTFVPAPAPVEATSTSGAVVSYTEPTATDVEDSPTLPAITCDANSGDTFPLGDTTVSCNAVDSAANSTNAMFVVSVVDTTPPVIALIGADPLIIIVGTPFVEPGAIATDIADGDISPSIMFGGAVDTSTLGSYTLTYDVIDGAGLSATQVERTVEVVPLGISVLPPITNTSTGESFSVTVRIETGGQAIDAAELHLNFDPSLLQVTNLTANVADLPVALQGPLFDNDLGTIDYTAVAFIDFPMGTLDILTIDFLAQDVTGGGSTPLFFEMAFPRDTQVTFGGTVQPLLETDAAVFITMGANTRPTVNITDPADSSGFDEFDTITFSATASDAEESGLESGIDWISDIDGDLGTDGASIMSALSPGLHTITARVTDSGGLVGSDSINVTVTGNTPPTVNITVPVGGATFETGASITFTANASDLPDGDLSPGLAWSSSIDGSFGSSGATVMQVLSDGVHTVTASVMDSGGLTGSAEITVIVQAPAQPKALFQVTPGGGLDASTFGGASNLVVQNTGDVGISFVSIDLSTAILPDNVFDPTGSGGDATAQCFTPDAGTAAATGLVAAANNCVDPFSVPRQGGFDVLSMTFTGFDPGETFTFSTDIDPNSIQGVAGAGNAGAVSGYELVGATITVTFSNGATLVSTLYEDGSLGGSEIELDASAPPAPSITVVGQVSPGVVTDISQTIVVTGTPGADIELLVMDSRLYIASGDAPFNVVNANLYANEAMSGKAIYSGTIGAGGTVEIPITLLATPSGNATPDGGLNQILAVELGSTSAVSNYVVLRFDPTGGSGGGAFNQGGDGTVSMEMENFDLNVVGSGASWTLVSDAGASDGMAMQAPGNGQPRLEYQVNFTQTGTHYVFVRAQGDSGSSNSMWLGFNGDLFMQNVNINPLKSWQWEGGYAINVPTPGEYTISMVRRESDALGDKIVIKTNNVAPIGTGPAQSLRGGGSNDVPVVNITSPTDGASVPPGSLIAFAGTANDTEDGDIGASLVWMSDLDGNIGNGTGFSTTLSVGMHTVSASVTDSGTEVGSDSITVTVNPDAAPTVVITGPADGSGFDLGDLINFAATAMDLEDGDIAAALDWTSSIDGSFGMGAGVPISTLSAGTHTITASVDDSAMQTGSAIISVTINDPGNDVPVVTITSPANGATVTDGDLVNFVGTASDTEDGDRTATLNWTSSVDGAIGMGGSFSTSSLSVGTHTITAEASDSLPQTGSSSILLTVDPLTGGSGAFIQGGDGTVSMEMENFDLNVVGSGASWTLVSDAGASDGMAMQAPGNGQPRLEYQVNFTQTGTHYVFVRAQGDSGSSNSMWLGFNGDLFMQNVNINPLKSWQWEGGYAINVPTPGEYTISMVRRESDALGDKIVIKTNNVAPIGTGPAQSLRGGGGSNTAPTVAITSPADGATFVSGDLVSFNGTADDTEDGDIAASLQWTSSLDGVIGTTAGFSTSTLNVGNHVITAAVTDSGGLPGNDVISVLVQAPSGTNPGLPFTEPFDDTNLRDAGNTRADWNILLTTDSIEPLQDTFGATSVGVDVGSVAELDHDLALGDIDGDGDKDLVLVGNGSDRYYLNNGTTTPFSAATSGVDLQTSSSTSRAVVLEDFDQDGHLDILIAKNGASVANQIYFNNGSSNPFNGVAPIDVGTNLVATGSIEVGDIDGDGDPDIVAGNTAAADVYYLNLGSRVFSVAMNVPVPLDMETKAVRLGDMNLDGRLDLVVATTLDPVLFMGELRLDVATGTDEGTFLYLNNGTATPFASVVPTRISDDENKLGSNGSMDLGDVNGDGYLDVIIGNLTFDRLYLNNASGPGSDPFLGVSGLNASSDERNTQSAVLADIDNDGDLDYLAGNKPRVHGIPADNVGTDRLYLNNGSGVFGSGIDISTDSIGDSQAIAATDIDDDSELEILVGDLVGVSRFVLGDGSGSGLAIAQQLHGLAQSLRVDTETGNIASVLLTVVDLVPAHTRIDYSLSNNGGQDWVRAYPDIQTDFVTSGNDLRWRADLDSRSPAGFASIDSLSIVLMNSGGSGPFQQDVDGTVSIEMENFDTSVVGAGASFAMVSVGDASDEKAMQAPSNGQPRLEYQVDFSQSGAHYVYVRGLGSSGSSNSLWLGFDGDFFEYNVNINPLNSWQWEGGFVIFVPVPGEYTLSITRRESDAMGDKIVIQTNLGTPTGTGPDQSPRAP